MFKRYRVQIGFSSEIDDGILTLGEREVSRLHPRLNRKNAIIAWGIVCFLFVLFSGRLWWVNVVSGETYTERSFANKTREYSLPAPRGKVSDRSGRVLVNNIPSTNIVAIESYLPDDSQERDSLIADAATLFSIPEEDIRSSFDDMRKSRQPQVVLKRDILREEMLRFLEQQDRFPGIALEQSVRRQYEESAIFSHIIGYEGKMTAEELEEYPEYALNDSIGRQGIERSYERYLRGTPGAKRLEVDALGRVQKEIASKSPVPGDDLILSINAELQKKLFDTISSELEKSGLESAAGVALDPRNGEVLALVSLPSFDNNVFSGGMEKEAYARIVGDSNYPLFNRAISGAYSPGSTIKPIMASAALEENIISEGKQIESRGSISIGGFSFGDWKAHGFTDIRRAIAVSSDVFFYSVGGGYGDVAGLGIDRMKRYSGLFGLGEKTGIDLPGEVSGFFPDSEWKQKTYGEPWYVGNSYHASIGQGFITATPLQMAVATAVVANGGTVYRPKIVSQARNVSGESISFPPAAIRESIVSPHTLQVVREGMRLTVTEGTAQQLKDLPVPVAGKTGTAQFGSEEKTHGWFESFAPYDNPEIVLVIMIEGQEKEDTYNAVPITREVLSWYFSEAERTR